MKYHHEIEMAIVTDGLDLKYPGIIAYNYNLLSI